MNPPANDETIKGVATPDSRARAGAGCLLSTRIGSVGDASRPDAPPAP